MDDAEKKNYKDAAKEALDKFKKDHPDLPKNTRKKKKKAEDGPPEKEEETEVLDDAGAGIGNDDKEKAVGAESNSAAADRPKRPPTANQIFTKEARPKLKEENPGASLAEIVSECFCRQVPCCSTIFFNDKDDS